MTYYRNMRHQHFMVTKLNLGLVPLLGGEFNIDYFYNPVTATHYIFVISTDCLVMTPPFFNPNQVKNSHQRLRKTCKKSFIYDLGFKNV